MVAKSPSKKGGKKKKLKKSSGSAVVPTVSEEGKLPPLVTNVRLATLQNAVVMHDTTSLSRLVAHYNYAGDMSRTNADRSTLIMTAVKTNDILCLKQLLGYGVIDINAREASLVGGYTALHHACLENHPAIVELLIQSGANPNVKSDSLIGESPLMICCKHGYLQCAQALLRGGADERARDNFGNNASFWAYRHNNSSMIRDLGLPATHTPGADEFLALQMKRIPGFVLPSIKKKSGKKGKGEKGKKKK